MSLWSFLHIYGDLMQFTLEEFNAIRDEYVETLSENYLQMLRRGHFDSLLKEIIPKIIKEIMFGGSILLDLKQCKSFEDASKELWDALKENSPDIASELVLQSMRQAVRDRYQVPIYSEAGLPNIWSHQHGAFSLFDQLPVEPKTRRNLNHE